MADISKVKIPSVSTPYNLKDANAGYSIEIVDDYLNLKNSAGTIISNAQLPSSSGGRNLEFVQGIKMHKGPFGSTFMPECTYIVDRDLDKAIGRIYTIDSFSAQVARQTKWFSNTTVAGNSFAIGKIVGNSVLYVGKILITDFVNSKYLGGYIERILTNENGGNYGANYHVVAIPLYRGLYINTSIGNLDVIIFNTSSTATDPSVNAINSRFIMTTESFRQMVGDLSPQPYIADVLGTNGQYTYTQNLKFDLHGYFGNITDIRCVYWDENGTEGSASISNFNMYDTSYGKEISIPQSAPSFNPNTGMPTNYTCKLRLLNNSAFVYETDVLTPAGQIV